jgi:hypothetical protein
MKYFLNYLKENSEKNKLKKFYENIRNNYFQI